MTKAVLFGRIAEAAGWREREVEPGRVSEIRHRLTEADEALSSTLGGPGVQVAVNRAIVRDDVAVGEDDEVAFLPPFSGG